METTIQKWGNSLGVRLPRAVTSRHGLSAGVRVVVGEKKGELTIRPIRRRKKTLRELVDTVTPRNRHAEMGWGSRAGQEAW